MRVQPVQSSNERIQDIDTNDPNIKNLLELQGECKIKSIQTIKISYLKIILLTIPIVASIVGLFLLKYKKWMRVMAFYTEESNIKNATHVFIQGKDTDPSEQIQSIFRQDDCQFFEFMKLKYHLRNTENALPAGFKYWNNYKTFFNQKHYQEGLTQQTQDNHLKEFGTNEHIIDIPSYFGYMFTMMTKPFFIMQYIIVIMYFLEGLVLFGILLLVMTLLTTSINYVLMYFSFKKTKEIAQRKFNVKVIRSRKNITIQNIELIPGDVLILQKGTDIPCDCILVQGDTNVNQSSLTGQSIPISKSSVENQGQLFDETKWLFEGSKVLDAKQNSKALVVNTGYATRRGRIIRKIVNTSISNPDISKSAFIFLMETLAVGIIVYLATLPILLAANIGTPFKVYRFFDYISYSCPPPFPIYFNIVYSFSLRRLRSKNIYGTQPQKTVEGGLLKILCFDKTGTLTENSLKIENIHLFERNESLSLDSEKLNDINNKQDNHRIMHMMFAACHNVKKIDEQFLGDEIDLRMFQKSQGRFVHLADQNAKFIVQTKMGRLSVLKVNQFQSKHQHMSVLVHSVSEDRYFVFVKGAPEKIHACSLTQFQYFEPMLKKASSNGQRAIGLAYIEIKKTQIQKVLSQQLSTEHLSGKKKQLTMIGMVTFENKLKDQVAETISRLNRSMIEPKIITGDNIYIAIETARKAGIFNGQKQNKVILLQGKNQANLGKDSIQSNRKFIGKYISIQNVDKPSQRTINSSPKVSQRPLLEKSSQEAIELEQNGNYLTQPYSIAVDNDFINLTPQPFLPPTVKIFARITPQNKALVVKSLKQNISDEYQKLTTWQKLSTSRQKIGMVGDGANDLMALKESDLGFGLNETDASYASSFTIRSLNDIDQVIREAKSTATIFLQVVCYFGAANMARITDVVIMLTESTYWSQKQQFLYNFTSLLILPILMAISGPSQLVTALRPISSVLCLKIHLIYWGNTILSSAGMALGYVYFYNQQGYVPNPNQRLVDGKYFSTNHVATAMWLLVLIPYLFISFYVTNIGPKFKKPFYKNYALLVVFLIDVTAYTTFYFVTERIKDNFNLFPIPVKDTGIMLAISAGFIIVSLLYNKWIQTLNFQKKQARQRGVSQDLMITSQSEAPTAAQVIIQTRDSENENNSINNLVIKRQKKTQTQRIYIQNLQQDPQN